MHDADTATRRSDAGELYAGRPMNPNSETFVEEVEWQADEPPADPHTPIPQTVGCERPEALACLATIGAQILLEE